MKNLQTILCCIFYVISAEIYAQSEISQINGLMQKGQYSQALVQLEQLNISDSVQLEVLQKQAFCNFRLGRFSQAKKLYYSALGKSPFSSEILL
jgi:tetratricopeptide (TPR) repeat protein